MPGFNPENINIHDLTIEEPESKVDLPFDPERDITEEDWERMKERLQLVRNKSYWPRYFEQVTAMKLLFPKRKSELNLDDEVWNEAIKQLNESKQKGNLFSWVNGLMKIKTLFPWRVRDLNIDDTAWQEAREQLELFRNGNNWGAFLSHAADMKIFRPESLDSINLGKTDWESMREKLKFFPSDKDKWQDFPKEAMELRILFPEKSLGISESDWEKMNDKLNDLRTSKSEIFYQHAMQMKVLAAEKVEITENGLEIAMPGEKKSLGSENLLIPDKRKF